MSSFPAIALRALMSPRALLFGLLALLSACQSLPGRPPMSFDEVAQWHAEGKSGGEIIALLETRRLPAHLSGSQLGRLKEKGVPDEVLDYLLNRHTEDVRYRSRLEAEPYWWHHPFFFHHHPVVVVEQPRR